MRANHEDVILFDAEFQSGSFSTASVALITDVEITHNGSILNFLDPNGSDREVQLPPLSVGRFYVVAHTGTANLLNIVDALGAAVTELETTESVMLFCDNNEWVGIKSLVDLDDFGIAGPNHKRGLVPDPGATFDADPSHRRYLSELGWAEISEITGDDFYKYFKGGAVTLTPVGADTLEFVSADNKLTILASAATTPDEIRFTINQGNIDHNSLLNYVADQHVAHSGVTLTAGNGLSGGGTIAASRTFDLDLSDLTTDTPVLADTFAFYDVSGSDTNKATLAVLNGILDHNSLLNYVADQHVAHSGVSITAGTGLTGGGTIAASRTLSLDINGLTADTLATGDFFVFYDISQSDHNKITFGNLTASIDHNGLLNYVANQHIDHTTVSISTASNSGLAGGGTIAATRTLTVDVNNLTTDATIATSDYIPFYDVSGTDTNKALISTLNGILVHNSLSGYVANEHINHTSVSISTGTGLTGGGDISSTRTLNLDFNALTADTPVTGDFFVFYDISGSDHNKVTLANLATALNSLESLSITFIIDGGGSAITTGVKGFLEIPFAATITQWTLLGNQSGSIVVDIWKDTYANYPPTVADTITASAKPTISTATKGQSSTLTGWTTSIAAGDILGFKVDSITTLTRVTLSLKVTRA